MVLLQVICGALAAACSGHLRDKVPTTISGKSVHEGICLHPFSQVVVRNGFAAVRFIMGWFRLPRVLQGTDSSGRVFRDAPSASGSRSAGDDFSLPLAEMISQDGLGSNMMVVGAMSQKAPWALASSSYQCFHVSNFLMDEFLKDWLKPSSPGLTMQGMMPDDQDLQVLEERLPVSDGEELSDKCLPPLFTTVTAAVWQRHLALIVSQHVA